MTKQRKSWLARKIIGMKRPLIADWGLESAVETLANNASNSSSSIAFLDSNELQQSPQIIATGEYTLLYALEGVVALSDNHTTTIMTNSSKHNQQDESEAAELKQRREALLDDALTNGPHQYVIKRLNNKKYLKGDKTLLKRGATKLVMEARVLSMLQGETAHVVALRALHVNVLDGCRNFEEFFLLTDRLIETLETRIQKWRKESRDKGEAPNDDHIPMKSNYAYQIAKAIKACHDHGIMIRDLTPSKIGFKDRHTLQLFGLGHSKVVGTDNIETATDDDNSDPLVGERRYMDGHIWMTGEYLFKSDVYTWSIIFYEMISETPPYAGLSSLDHQQLVCAQGHRPSLTTCYVPPVVDTLLAGAWDPNLQKRFNSTQVCEKMQHFLMELDSCYYDQEEEDFLFDIDVKYETVSNFEDDKWFEQGKEDDYEARIESIQDSDLIHDDSSSYSDGGNCNDSSSEFMAAAKSKLSDSSSSYAAFSINATTPKKVIPTAA